MRIKLIMFGRELFGFLVDVFYLLAIVFMSGHFYGLDIPTDSGSIDSLIAAFVAWLFLLVCVLLKRLCRRVWEHYRE